MSIPSSFITAIASDRTLPGRVPALCTSKRSPAACRSKPSAIWLRAELPVQRINTRFFIVLVLEENLFLGAAAGRAARRYRWLVCTNKRADEFAFHLSGPRLDLEALARQKGPRVLQAVNPRGLDLDMLKTGLGEFGHIFFIAQSPGDAASPKLQVFLDFARYVAPDHHIGDREAAAWFEHAKRFLEHAVLVTRKVDHAVGDDHVHRSIRQRNVLY